MPQYKCRRCGYTSNLKANIRRHFLKKTLCSPLCTDIKIEDVIVIPAQFDRVGSFSGRPSHLSQYDHSNRLICL